MPSDIAVRVAVYDSHTDAEEGVKQLQRGGFDMKKLSIVGRECPRCAIDVAKPRIRRYAR